MSVDGKKDDNTEENAKMKRVEGRDPEKGMAKVKASGKRGLIIKVAAVLAVVFLAVILIRYLRIQ